MAFASELRGVVTGVALAAIAVLLAISVPLGLPGQELLQTLRFHIGIAAILLPILLFVLGARLRGVVMLALVLASLGQGAWIVFEQLQRRTPMEAQTTAASLSLLSFNVLASNDQGKRVVDYMIASQPDIAIVMETPGIEAHLDDLKAIFPTRIGCSTTALCDISMFSRLPVTEQQVYDLGPFKRQRLITAKVIVGGQPVTIIALHLSKPYFDDFGWIELTELRSLLRQITGPVILAGDFNAAAWSTSVAKFSKQMNLAPPPTFPATWPVELDAFGVPIDNMFSRDGALIRTITAVPDPMGSNHRGLLAKIDLVASPD